MSAFTNLALDHIEAEYSISETTGRFTEDSEHWLFEAKRVRLAWLRGNLSKTSYTKIVWENDHFG